MKQRICWSLMAAGGLLFVAGFCLALVGCGTVTPDPVKTTAPSYDGAVQDGGLKAVVTTQPAATTSIPGAEATVQEPAKPIETVHAATDQQQLEHQVQASVQSGSAVSGFVISADARDRYNYCLHLYGKELYGVDYPSDYGVTRIEDGDDDPANDRYLITPEAMTMFIACNRARKMDGK